MARWVLPLAAACFGIGGLALRRPLAAGRAWPAAVAVGLALVAAGRARWGTVRSPPEVLARVLGHAPPEVATARARILQAAGLPGEGRSDPRWRGREGAVRALALALGWLVLGGGWWAWRGSGAVLPRNLDGREVAFRGRAASDPDWFDFGWGGEAIVDRAWVDGRPVGALGRVWLSGSGRPPDLEAGQPLRGQGTVRAVHPGGSGFEGYLADRGFVAIVSVRDARSLGPATNPAMRLANAVRGALRRGVEVGLPPRHAGLILGLTIGDTSRLDPEVEEDFRATGLGHLVAVSGENVAMFLAPFMALVAGLRARRGLRLAAGSTAVILFALVTRWEPSVLRASAMAVLALLGTWLGRPRSVAPLLGGAVLLLLVADPSLSSELGFQLSVAATIGLATLAGPVMARLHRVPRPIASAAAATIAAQAGVTPLLLVSFGVVPTVTLLANVLAFPAVAPAMLGGLVTGLGSSLTPSLGGAIGVAASVPVAYLEALADHAAKLPLPIISASGLALPLSLGVLAAIVLRRRPRGRGRRAAAALLVAGLVWWLVGFSTAPETFTVVFLDVGQGDAAVVFAPDGATVVIDAGPDDQQLAAELARLGVRRIDLGVASHGNADHINGFPAVFARYEVGLFIEPGCPSTSPSYRRLLDAIEDEDVAVHHPRGGQRLVVGMLTIDVLGPDRCSPLEDGDNDDSLILRVRLGGWSVLFTGDAEVPAQRDLLEDGDQIEADVLKVPHHGGDTSDPEFFRAVDADVAVVSTGPNTYGHPVPSVLAELRSAGMRVYRTDFEGDITVRFTPGGVLVDSER